MNKIRFEVVKKIAETNFRTKNLKDISKLNTASPPSVFIGSRLKYPLVNVGIMSPLERDEDAWIYDDEKYWADNDFEISDVLNAQGLDIDIRHLKLAADAMTNTGIVKGVTRMGIISQKSSVLARATFETPDKQFVNASIKGSGDKLTSVIENIILNQPVPIGTGLPGLLVKVIGPLVKKDEEKKTAKKKVVEATNK